MNNHETAERTINAGKAQGLVPNLNKHFDEGIETIALSLKS